MMAGLRSATRLRTFTSAIGPSAASAEKSIKEDSSRRKRVLSGIQPTGTLHLGNYLGAIRQWVKNQDENTTASAGITEGRVDSEGQGHENFFMVVDLHAITAPHDPNKLKHECLSAAAVYLAAGIDPMKSTVFIQSHVRAHAELAWLLNCITPMSWLERMIQYKEKAIKQGETTGVGLFTYPVLMAADILLYQTDYVPVGEDQRQHLELTRDIARRFNDQYCSRNKGSKSKSRVFREPTAMIEKEGARVMSLLDGTSKMSKSTESDNSRINLLDDPLVIHSKIKRCKSDLHIGLEFDNVDRPECTNLLNIYLSVSGKTRKEVEQETCNMSWGTFKPILADSLVSHLLPIQEKYRQLMCDQAYLEQVLLIGSKKADTVAEYTLRKAKDAMGFHMP